MKAEGVEKDMEVSKDLDAGDSVKEEEQVEESADEKKPSKKMEVVENEDEEPQCKVLIFLSLNFFSFKSRQVIC